MRIVRFLALSAAGVCFLVSALTWGQGGNRESGGAVEQQIKTLEAQRIAAILKSDTSFFEKNFVADYVAIRGDGKQSTKAQEIESLKSGITKYESIDERELTIRIYGDTAICNGLSSIKATINGKPYSGDVRNTRVWVKQEGSWKLATFQATRVAP
jgi:ketosteroid isomerase-like protein